MQKGVPLLVLPLVLAVAGCDTGAAEPAESGRTRIDAGKSFTCTPEKLWDGDGPIHCAEGPKVRLAGIAAREMDGTCKPGHPCPSVSAKQSRDHLAALLIGNPPRRGINFNTTGHIELEGPMLSCVSAGSAGGNRTAAWCVSPFVGDLSCRMVRDGYALKWPRYWRDHRC